MVSTLTEKGADVTFEAMDLGAVDFVTKPKIDLAHTFEAPMIRPGKGFLMGLKLIGDGQVQDVRELRTKDKTRVWAHQLELAYMGGSISMRFGEGDIGTIDQAKNLIGKVARVEAFPQVDNRGDTIFIVDKIEASKGVG